MEPTVARGVMILRPARKIWDTLKQMYRYVKNISRIFEVYEQIFTLKMEDSLVQDHFASLRALLDELDLYQPLTSDIATMRRYRMELAITAYLSGLTSEL